MYEEKFPFPSRGGALWCHIKLNSAKTEKPKSIKM